MPSCSLWATIGTEMGVGFVPKIWRYQQLQPTDMTLRILKECLMMLVRFHEMTWNILVKLKSLHKSEFTVCFSSSPQNRLSIPSLEMFCSGLTGEDGFVWKDKVLWGWIEGFFVTTIQCFFEKCHCSPKVETGLAAFKLFNLCKYWRISSNLESRVDSRYAQPQWTKLSLAVCQV